MAVPADPPVVNEVVASVAVTTFSNGISTDFFVVNVDPTTNELATLEFYEKRRDLGEIQLLKQVNWEVQVPQDAMVFIATGGLLHDHLNAFWVGWRTSEKLSALSVFQESPIDVPLDPGMTLVDPPIVLPSKKMRQYLWLSKDNVWPLFKYEFRGNQGERGSVTRERIHQADHKPILSAALPIPGAEDDRTAVAWIEETDTGIKASAMLSKGDSSEVLDTPVIPFIKPLGQQRLAMHADEAGVVSAGFVAESRIGGYMVLEIRFDFGKHIFTFQSSSLGITPGTVHSACMFYYKDPQVRSSFVCVLLENGSLAVAKPESDSMIVFREQVGDQYDFPIVTSATGRYEAVRVGGRNELSTFP